MRKIPIRMGRSVLMVIGLVSIGVGVIVWYIAVGAESARNQIREISPWAASHTYALVTRPCEESRAGACQDLVQRALDQAGSSTERVVATLTPRYEARGGRAHSLELLTLRSQDSHLFLAENFPSDRARQVWQFDMATGSLEPLGLDYNPFAGDRVSPAGQYIVTTTEDFQALELVTLRNGATTTPFRLADPDETLSATTCGYGGKVPNLAWLSDTTIQVEIFSVSPERSGDCAGPSRRTVAVVVE
jgi:hypothetical protein